MATIVALCLLALPAAAQTLTFRADAGQLSLHSRQGKRAGEFVEVTLPGSRFSPPQEIPLIERAAVDRTTPKGVLISMRSANLAGDAAWIAENFAPQDQERLRKLLADPGMIAKNRAYYSTVKRVLLLESVRIRQYTVLVVNEQSAQASVTHPVTMIETPRGWRVTNDLADDATLDVVWRAVADLKP